ncbi:MAG: hypothetical protein ACRD8A_05495 [Candidatus Acidiferrales bacterium]
MPSPQRKRLDSWKAIAEYLGRNVRTVTRWAEQRELPVHRVPGGKRQSVFAYSDEIDAWLLNQRSISTEEAVGAPAAELVEHREDLRSRPLHGPASRIGKFSWFAIVMAILIGGAAWIANILIEGRHRAAAAVPLAFVQLTNDGRSKNHFQTDGRTLYFDESEGDALSLFSLRLDGSQPQQIHVAVPNPVIQDVSRDKQQLLVTSSEGVELEQPLWIVPMSGRLARRLPNLACELARWSPDGQRIACANGTSVTVVNSDGTHVRTLASLPSIPFRLAWTPDGARLIFVLGNAYDPALSSAWEISADTHKPKESAVELPWGKNCCVDWAWTDGGRRLLYLKVDTTGHPVLDEVGALNESSQPTERTRLPVNVGRILGFLADDEKDLIYLLIEGKARGEVLKVGPTKTTYQVILPGLSAGNIAYSRDGRWMTFVRPDDQTLWRSRADGTDVLQLTTAPTEAQISSWSPDGRTIAYMRKAPRKPWRIFFVGRDGTREREAMPGGTENEGAPSWSPDGKELVYGDVLCQEEDTCWIHELNLRTGEVTRLPGSHGLRTARFSPNGRYIAALQPEKHEGVLFNVKTKTWSMLAGSVTGDNINWSADSRYIFADSPRIDHPVIEKIRVSDGRRVTVANLTPLERMTGLGSPWFGLAPDGSPILLHLFNSSEIYALNWKFH